MRRTCGTHPVVGAAKYRMRYWELIETSPGERIAQANHKKAEAARAYQDRLSKARASKAATQDRETQARQSYQDALNSANDSIRRAGSDC